MPDKRTDIVEAALVLVREEGLAGLTQPRVAKRLGLRQSHVTYYFPTRDDLLAAVTELAVQRRVTAVNAMIPARSVRSKLLALATMLTDPEQTRVLLALTQMTDSTPALRPHFRALGGGIAPAATGLLQAAGAEPSPAARALLQTTSTGLAIVALATGNADPAPVVDLLTRLLDSLPRSGQEPS